MHRYPAVSGVSGVSVGSNTSSGVPREIVRPDLAYPASSSFTVPSRRPAPLAPYTLKCDQEPLSARLGPPDYFPPTPNCAEESLSRDACQNGYKETVDGIEEAQETTYTLVRRQVWTKPSINNFKETIRKRLNLLSNSQLRKRKAGQVYGVPLSGPLLAKSGHFPEQRHSGEDNRKRWIEDLAQHKRLRVLADHVPHGLRRQPLFEALIKNNVPFLRATWCIKILYLNQVRPLSIGMSSGGGDKLQQKRVELWTKDLLEYMQCLLDEKVQHRDMELTALGRDNCGLLPLSVSSRQASDFSRGSSEIDDPPLEKKWHYMLQILLLHFSEGLLNRSHVIDWVLTQLKEREALDAMEFLLPVVSELIDKISTCQTLVRMVVEICLHKLGQLCPSGGFPIASEQPRLHCVATFTAEVLSYLLTVAPDSFVALDCFPLPPCVMESNCNRRIYFPVQLCEHKAGRAGPSTFGELQQHPRTSRSCETSIDVLAAGIKKRASSLAKAVNPASLKKNEATVVHALDIALLNGDIHAAYQCIFDDDFCGHEQPPDEWLSKLSPWLKLSPYFSGNASLSEVFAVSFLCEWAICDFRDCRKMLNSLDPTTMDVRAVCRVHMAVSVLLFRAEEKAKQDDRGSSMNAAGNCVKRNDGRKFKALNDFGNSLVTYFESPSLIHDIIVAWIDQHDLRKGQSFERLQLLLFELVRKRLFWPPAYVRKLLVGGVLENKETSIALERASRHRCLLQHLPSLSGLEVDKDDKKPSNLVLKEALRIFQNERHFCLHGLDNQQSRTLKRHSTRSKQEQAQAVGLNVEGSNDLLDSRPFRESKSMSAKRRKGLKKKMRMMELKQAVARCLHFPDWCIREEAEPVYDKLTVGQGSTKRQLLQQGSSMGKPNVTLGCEDCGRTKKLKSNEGISVFHSAVGFCQVEEEGLWWSKKVVKATADTVKTEPIASIKPPKQPLRGRPKSVRKLSLSQLDAGRTDGSQGASSSHTCDTKANLSHHKSAVDVNTLSGSKDKKKPSSMHHLKTICTMFKWLRLTDRRAFALWLDETVRVLIEGSDNVASVSTSLQHSAKSQVHVSQGNLSQAGSSVPSCERSSTRWQFGEEELATIVCLLDKANDHITLMRLLVWLLPKAIMPPGSSPGQTLKLLTAPWNKDSTCNISESVVLACLRRYEGVLLAANLLPMALSAGMHRVALLTPTGSASRVVCPALSTYLHDLHRKYGQFQSFQDWEINWKVASSQRLVVDFEALKTAESDSRYPFLGIHAPNVGDDRDDCLPLRSVGRFVKVGPFPFMRDIVRRGFQEAINQMVLKERDLSASVKSKDSIAGQWFEGLQAAHNVVTGLTECVKQQMGTPSGDVQLAAAAAAAAAAASAVVSNVFSSIAFVFENLNSNNSYSSLSSSGITIPSSRCARRVVHAHVQCLRLLKESLGDKLHRVLESALTAEVTAVVANVIGHPSGRPPRSQFQLSPETPEPSSSLGEMGAGSNGSTLGRSSTIAAAIAAFLIVLVLDDVVTLERMISLLRIKEGLDTMQLTKGGGLNANAISRVLSSGSGLKNDSLAEVCVFWFRVLIGDCKPVAGGLVAEILGESSMLAFVHRQRMLPLSTIFLPAYSLFLIAIRGQPFPMNISNRDETSNQQLAHSAFADLLLHDPFREVCLKDTRELHVLLARDSSEYEHAALLDSKGADFHTKLSCMVPSRPRLFLHSILECKLPAVSLDEFSQGRGSMKNQGSLVEELVQLLDDMHPATFHWQWLELRLLLNEQVFMENFEGHNMLVAAEAVQAARSAVEEGQKLSESEKNFTEILLTRLLVRPDAAALYSEALHILGRPFEEYLILQVQWILENNEMLLGRKFLRQQLMEMAQRKKLKLNSAKIKVWEWLPPQFEECNPAIDSARKVEFTSLEEGEVAEEDTDCSKPTPEGISGLTNCSQPLKRHFAMEKALADLVLPCLARSSLDIYSRFASQLVKQISDLEQQITLLSGSSGRTVMAVAEGGTNKRFGLRKGPRISSEMGSPSMVGLSRWTTSGMDSAPPSAAALQTSLWLRFRFLLLLLPPIYSDRERSNRAVLAPVLLRLLGTRFVQENVEAFCSIQGDGGRDLDWNAEAAAAAAAVAAGEDLFDHILSVLHALLSSTWPVWLKQKPSHKPSKPVRDVPPLDKEVVNRMQTDLDHMQLPLEARVRLQAAMPILAASSAPTFSAGPPQMQGASLSVVQTCATNPAMLGSLNGSYKHPVRVDCNFGKIKPAASQETDTEIDPWTLLEDLNSSGGTGVPATGVLSSESGSNKACAWLKGAVRVRRTDLSYVGSIDDDT